MNRRKNHQLKHSALSVLPLLCALLAGCGGGTSSGSNRLSSGLDFQTGPFTGRAANLNRPVFTNGNSPTGAAVVGFTGQISRLEARFPVTNPTQEYFVYDTDEIGKRSILLQQGLGFGDDTRRIGNGSSDNTQPVISPDGGKIAYVSTRDGNLEIYMTPVMADGVGADTRLTNNTAGDINPAWSPDGTKIAFASSRDGNWEIYVMNADGSSQTRLTNNTKDDQAPVWSPDGKKIAFSSLRDGHSEIYMMNADGTSQTRLTNTAKDSYEPAWSPNGRNIAFTTNRDGNNEIYVMNVDGSGYRNVTNNSASDTSPTWDIDGQGLLFITNRDSNPEIYHQSQTSPASRVTSTTAKEANVRVGPPVRRYAVIGTGSVTAASATGFLAGYRGDFPASIVTINNSSFSDLLMTTPTGVNNNGPILLFDVEGASAAVTLTDVYWRNFEGNIPTQKLVLDGTVVNGIIATFSAMGGDVISIFPFTAANRSVGKPIAQTADGVTTLHGSFTGAWDANQKNLAPHGAKEIRINAQTGAILGVK